MAHRPLPSTQATEPELEQLQNATTAAAGTSTAAYGAVEETYYGTMESRVRTFVGFRSAFVNPTDLARSGFYWTREADIVQCFECGVAVGMWEPGDVPDQEHIRWNARCPYMMTRIPTSERIEQGGYLNNYIESRLARSLGSPSTDREVSGVASGTRRRAAENVYSFDSPGLSQFRVIRKAEPKFPQQRMFDQRYASYEDWPAALECDRRAMASSGLFYTKKGDLVQCAFCGVEINRWFPGNDPWRRHAQAKASCSYLLTVMGSEFAIDSAESNAPPPPVEETLVDEETEDGVSRGRRCVICLEKEVSVAFLPCSHLCTCLECWETFDHCPMCRADINAVIRVYLP